MAEIAFGVILNGVTGRMGTNQHLVRSILAIREQGGVSTADGDRIMPEPVLVGRNPDKLRHLSAAHNVSKWTTNLDEALADDHNRIYFDALATNLRVPEYTAGDRGGQGGLLRKADRRQYRGMRCSWRARRSTPGSAMALSRISCFYPVF